MKEFIRKFSLCGLMGWCLECFWTGLYSATHEKDRNFTCKTSFWMFPIYGLAAFLEPICRRISRRCVAVRGIIYTMIIFTTELLTGSILRRHGIRPWDYSKARTNIKGLIRLDYAPLWFLVGLLYEQLLGVRRCPRNK